MNFSTEDKKLMLDLIGKEQIDMIIKHPESYISKEYMLLERLKIKIKDIMEDNECTLKNG